jgi:hypothetical protein
MTTAVAEAVQRGLHPQLSCRINHSKRKASHYIQLEQATLSSVALLLSFLAKQKDDEHWLSRHPFRLLPRRITRMYRDDVSRGHDMPPGLAARLNPVDYVRLNVDNSHLVSTQVAAY